MLSGLEVHVSLAEFRLPCSTELNPATVTDHGSIINSPVKFFLEDESEKRGLVKRSAIVYQSFIFHPTLAHVCCVVDGCIGACELSCVCIVRLRVMILLGFPLRFIEDCIPDIPRFPSSLSSVQRSYK